MKPTLVEVMTVFLIVAAPLGAARAAERPGGKVASKAESVIPRRGRLGALKQLGLTVARLMTEKKYDNLHGLSCAADKARLTPKRIDRALRELHEVGGTTAVSLANDREILDENASAFGAKTPADFEKLTQARLNIRLHATIEIEGRKLDATSVQVWTVQHEGKGWCVLFEDLLIAGEESARLGRDHWFTAETLDPAGQAACRHRGSRVSGHGQPERRRHVPWRGGWSEIQCVPLPLRDGGPTCSPRRAVRWLSPRRLP